VTDLAGITVTPVKSITAHRLDQPWPWAEEHRRLIESHWAGLTRSNPALYNGRILVRRGQSLREGSLSLDYVETDYASFIAFRDHGFPDPTSGNGFAMAALRSADEVYLLGRMADHTANAGKVYFPSGTPDPGDVRSDGTVDLAGSVVRELEEETGLRSEDLELTDSWVATFAGARTAMMREVRVRAPADAVRERIREFLRREERPELDDIRIVRSTADIDPEAMPPFMQAYLRFALEAREQR